MSALSYTKFYDVVMTSEVLRASAKIVFVVLANLVKACPNPKVDTIARKCGCSRRTVFRGLAELKQLNLVTVTWGQRMSFYGVAPPESWRALLMRPNGTSETASDVPKRHGAECQTGTSETPVSLLSSKIFLKEQPTTTTTYSVPSTTSAPATAGQQQAVVGVALEKYPNTARAVRENYPSVDDGFLKQLISQTERIAGDIQAARKLEFSDELMADAVKRCREDVPHQKSAGLFFRTVPLCVTAWIKQGREATKKAAQSQNWVDRRFEGLAEEMRAERLAREAKAAAAATAA